MYVTEQDKLLGLVNDIFISDSINNHPLDYEPHYSAAILGTIQ